MVAMENFLMSKSNFNPNNPYGLTMKQVFFHPISIIAFLVVFFPIGLILMWVGKVFSITTRMIISLFFLLIILMVFLTDDLPSESSQQGGTKSLITLDETSLNDSYLVTHNIATIEFLNAALPKTEENKAYYNGRVDEVFIENKALSDDRLVIKLKMRYDSREKYELTSDFYDEKLIREIMRNALDYLVNNGHNPDDKGFSIRVSATIKSVNKSPTGKALIESRGVARYSPNSTYIDYRTRDW